MMRNRTSGRLRWTAGAAVLAALLGLAGPATAQLDEEAPLAGDNLDEAPELTERTQAAIERGLEFLARTQNEDGSWSREDQYAVADTALALMAFMVKAHFPGEGPYGDKLAKGLDFLLRESKASPDGYLGTSMYAHGLATLALSEAWGMSDTDKDDDILEA